jgi:ferredoxin
MIPKVDQEKCIGCGACAALCPGVYKMNDDNKAEVFDVAGDTEENIQMSVNGCPTQAISVE